MKWAAAAPRRSHSKRRGRKRRRRTMSLKISGREGERGRRPQSSSSSLGLSLLRRVQISSSLSLLCSRRQKKDAAVKERFCNVSFFAFLFLGGGREEADLKGEAPFSQCSPRPPYQFLGAFAKKSFFTGRKSEAGGDVSGCRPPPPPPPQKPSVRK